MKMHSRGGDLLFEVEMHSVHGGVGGNPLPLNTGGMAYLCQQANPWIPLPWATWTRYGTFLEAQGRVYSEYTRPYDSEYIGHDPFDGGNNYNSLYNRYNAYNTEAMYNTGYNTYDRQFRPRQMRNSITTCNYNSIRIELII